MAVPFQATWEPNGPFPLVRDEHFQGSMRVVLYASAELAAAVPSTVAQVCLNKIPRADLQNTSGPAGFPSNNADTGESAFPSLDTYGTNPNGRRKRGMLVRAINVTTGAINEFTFNGTNFVDYVPANAPANTSFGVTSGCLVTGNGTNLTLTIAAGTLTDRFGRRVNLLSSQTLTVVSSTVDEVFVIVWDPAANAIAAKKYAGDSGGASLGADSQDLVLALARVTFSGVYRFQAADVIDLRFFDSGESSKGIVTVGATVGTTTGANFASLRQALLYVQCFKDEMGTSAVHATRPKRIEIVTDIVEPYVAADNGCIKIDTTSPFWTEALDRLQGVTVSGRSGATGSGINGSFAPTLWTSVTWGGVNQRGFLLELPSGVANFTVERLALRYAGTGTLPGNPALATVFRNCQSGFRARDIVFLFGLAGLSHFALWDGSATEFDFVFGPPGSSTVFERITTADSVYFASQASITGTTSWFKVSGTNTDGSLIVRDSIFSAAALSPYFDYFLDLTNSAGATTARFLFDNVTVAGIDVAVTNGATSSSKYWRNCKFKGVSALAFATATGTVQSDLYGCEFSNSAITMTGVNSMVACKAVNVAVTTVSSNHLIDCSQVGTGTFTGAATVQLNASSGDLLVPTVRVASQMTLGSADNHLPKILNDSHGTILTAFGKQMGSQHVFNAPLMIEVSSTQVFAVLVASVAVPAVIRSKTLQVYTATSNVSLTINGSGQVNALGGAAAVDNTCYYVFARLTPAVVATFGVISTLVYSITPPTAFGNVAPADVEGGFTQEDYVYIGSFFTGTLAGSGTDQVKTPDVVNYPNGVRYVHGGTYESMIYHRTLASSANGTGVDQGQIAVATIGVEPTLITTETLSPNIFIPTAFAFELQSIISIDIVNLFGVAVGFVSVNNDNDPNRRFVFQSSLTVPNGVYTPGDRVACTQNAWAQRANAGGEFLFRCRSSIVDDGAGPSVPEAISFNASVGVIGYLEDVNNPVPYAAGNNV